MRTFTCRDCGPEILHEAKPMGRTPTRCPDHAEQASRAASNASAKRWQENNRDKANENYRRWREQNKEQANAASAAWRREHPDRNRRSIKRWKKANPQKVAAGKRKYKQALKSAPTIPYTDEQWRQKVAYWGGRCHICGGLGADTRDHVKPISAGGWHCLANVRPAHRGCNTGKGAKWPTLVRTAPFV